MMPHFNHIYIVPSCCLPPMRLRKSWGRAWFRRSSSRREALSVCSFLLPYICNDGDQRYVQHLYVLIVTKTHIHKLFYVTYTLYVSTITYPNTNCQMKWRYWSTLICHFIIFWGVFCFTFFIYFILKNNKNIEKEHIENMK